MSFSRINKYEIMWLFVFFDLPVRTKTERKHAAKFRKCLMKDGFIMMQYSIYIRHCSSRQNADVHLKRVKKLLLGAGQVSIMMVTDYQYGNILNYWGRSKSELPEKKKQLQLF